MASASEAEYAALFINVSEATVVQTTLKEMGHPQPATTMQVDKSTYDGIINRKIQQNSPRQCTCGFIGWEI